MQKQVSKVDITTPQNNILSETVDPTSNKQTSKMFPSRRSLLALLATAATITNVNAAAEPTCACKAIAESFIVTRLWNIIDPAWTDQMVIDEFDRGFAPDVTHLPGFQEYASADTGDERTVFFMNIFESKEFAKAAQEGAKTFVQKGVLNGIITPNQFTENDMEFHISSDECIVDSNVGKFIGTQIWTIKPELYGETNLTIAGVAQEFFEYYGPTVESIPGFMEYGGALVSGTDKVFLYTVFDNAEGVTAANGQVEDFVANDEVLNDTIEKIVFTEGTIGFDYTCAAGNLPDETIAEDAGATDEAASSAMTATTFGGLFVASMMVMMAML